VLDEVPLVDDNDQLLYYSMPRLEHQKVIFGEQEQAVKSNIEQKTVSALNSL